MEILRSDRIAFFSQMISCGQNLYLWEYDASMQLVDSNCTQQELFSNVFVQDGCPAFLSDCIAKNVHHPMLFYSKAGFSWIAVFENGEYAVSRVYLLGPVFNSDKSYPIMMHNVQVGGYSDEIVERMTRHVEELPVITLSSWMQYGLMLHYCINEEKLEISDFVYPVQFSPPAEETEQTQAPMEGVWLAEKAALRMITEGCLDYQKAYSKLSMYMPTVNVRSEHQRLDDYRNAVCSFVTLCTRAAIEGGVDSQIAYYIGQQYMGRAQACLDLADLVSINAMMYDDFVHRVHKIRASSGISSSIRACCDYIDLHLADKISLEQLAEQTGYSQNHLSQKFKKETGSSITQYIKEQRVKRAKLLLRSTKETVWEIGESLGFCNHSYFAETFRSMTGMTPAQYREQAYT